MTAPRPDEDHTPIVLIAVGVIGVVPQLLVGGAWGAESTVAALFIAVGLVLQLAELRRARPQVRPPTTPSVAWSYARALLGVGAVTALGLAAYDRLGLPDLAMLYLVAIMLASHAGPGPSVVASSLSVAAFNFCFVSPRYSFTVTDLDHVVTFGVMFAAGLATSTLTARLRRREREARTEELRSSLLSAVSHDLRTPLATITGAATSLRSTNHPPAIRADLLDSIVDESRRLERVLNNLLSITRLETGLQPAREWVAVVELCGPALRRLSLPTSSVTIDIPPDLLIHVDPVLFEHVFLNLLDNAAKHGTPPIHLSARALGRTTELTISDAGPGLPRGTETLAFTKFYRASPHTPGIGLGLAVVRAITLAHGGTITAHGSEFTLTLPTPAPPRPE